MKRRLTVSDALFSSSNYLFLLLLGAATLYPFANLLALSFNDSLDSIKGGIYLWPREWTLDNYAVMLSNDQLLGSSIRSIVRTVLGTALGMLATAFFAFALSSKEFIFRKGFNTLLVITLYVNGGLIPIYLVIKNLGLTNSYLVYILPLLVNGFHIIIMRSYFDQLPAGLIESAKIDGASYFQTLFRIVLPISLPVIATIALFISVSHWNSWFDNYLYNSRDKNLSLLQYELMKVLLDSSTQASGQMRVDENSSNLVTPQSLRATMTIIVTVPILFVYPFLQNYFIQGMTIGAMKE
jgi:putative aldouronate transport system permease protein